MTEAPCRFPRAIDVRPIRGYAPKWEGRRGLNELYFGDNLDVLRRHVKSESVDLVYLDPPFKKNQDYNVLFKEQSGKRAAAQIKVFTDTWRWDEASTKAYWEIVEAGGPVSRTMQAFHTAIGENDMLAYLSMMAPRLLELERVLKSTGSIYLHCDPTASHYLKVLMDAVFGPTHFRSEIIWKRTTAHSDTKQGRQQHGRVHDVLLFYTKGDSWTWNPVYIQYDPDYVADSYRYVEPLTGRRYGLWDITGPGGALKGNPRYEVMGVTRFWRYSREVMDALIAEGRIVQTRLGAVPRYKRYLDEGLGVPLQDVWTDLGAIGAQAAERLGYPTQKPESLLRRIIQSSSSEGDTVLDPFCGCGTTVAVAEEKPQRCWIGIDVTQRAITLIKHRLITKFQGTAQYRVIGEPISATDAEVVAHEDPFQFQLWALGLVGARPQEGLKKGADKGIDGRIFFRDELPSGKTKQILISVKGGQLQPAFVQQLRGIIDKERAEIGVLITMRPPTKAMRAEAAAAGYYVSAWGRHPRIQILTVEDMLNKHKIDYPLSKPIELTARKPTVKHPTIEELLLPLAVPAPAELLKPPALIDKAIAREVAERRAARTARIDQVIAKQVAAAKARKAAEQNGFRQRRGA